eukprot:scaffold5062_cov104-Skeletonema_marinoi.AAC.4
MHTLCWFEICYFVTLAYLSLISQLKADTSNDSFPLNSPLSDPKLALDRLTTIQYMFTKRGLLESLVCSKVVLAAVSDASSGHLRRCSDADTIKESLNCGNDASILSWPAMMGH